MQLRSDLERLPALSQATLASFEQELDDCYRLLAAFRQSILQISKKWNLDHSVWEKFDDVEAPRLSEYAQLASLFDTRGNECEYGDCEEDHTVGIFVEIEEATNPQLISLCQTHLTEFVDTLLFGREWVDAISEYGEEEEELGNEV